jgi:hypothetical protein
MSYLIHVNMRHDPKTGRFTWGDGDNDGKKNDKSDRFTKTPVDAKIDKIRNYKKIDTGPTRNDKSDRFTKTPVEARVDKTGNYKKVQTGPTKTDKTGNYDKVRTGHFTKVGVKGEEGTWDRNMSSGGSSSVSETEFVEDVGGMTLDELEELLDSHIFRRVTNPTLGRLGKSKGGYITRRPRKSSGG